MSSLTTWIAFSLTGEFWWKDVLTINIAKFTMFPFIIDFAFFFFKSAYSMIIKIFLSATFWTLYCFTFHTNLQFIWNRFCLWSGRPKFILEKKLIANWKGFIDWKCVLSPLHYSIDFFINYFIVGLWKKLNSVLSSNDVKGLKAN